MFDLLMWGTICGCRTQYGFVPWLSLRSAGGQVPQEGKCPRGYFLPEASWFASEPCDRGSLERGFHQLPEPGFPEGLGRYRQRELHWDGTWKLQCIMSVSGPLWTEQHFRESPDLVCVRASGHLLPG